MSYAINVSYYVSQSLIHFAKKGESIAVYRLHFGRQNSTFDCNTAIAWKFGTSLGKNLALEIGKMFFLMV